MGDFEVIRGGGGLPVDLVELEPSNFELIEQGLLRLDPETREHVIAAMLVIQRYRGDRRVFTRLIATSPLTLPPLRLVSPCT